MKIKTSPSFLLGLICLALVLLLGEGVQCGRQCNTTDTNCLSGCSVGRPSRPTPPRPPTPRPPPPRPPTPRPPPPRPPTPRPPPPTPRPPPPRPPTPRPPPPPTPRPPPPRPPTPRPPPPPTPRPPPPPTPRPPPPSPPTPRPPPPPPPSPPTPSPPSPPSPEPPTPPEPTPPTPTPPTHLTDIISEEMFNEFLLNRIQPRCPGRWFYTYQAFITAAETFPEFGNTGNDEIRKREIAAFFGQTSHETSGEPTAQHGPFTWGYCFIEEIGAGPLSQYCAPSVEWPCIRGRFYYGRGPVQLTWNFNYGKAGEALGLDLLFNPDIVAHDPVISFETAIWFWMTPEGNKPSSHEVITGQWTPTPADIARNRLPGYGLITNIFNGALECGTHGPDNRGENRIQFYQRYCDLLDVSYGDNLDCYRQTPFDWGLKKLQGATESWSSS
ncbi:hypothetical protein BVRB_004860 [Beta vulgaris subsp. vulgaris]|uniref:chitinase n=1 Tax=Beta vulgaris subsp. vulgaris TaxID=3555 RepID=A0A0J8B464_BETVV|nr:hypothetical protein BVRB_004860 [Beta vulgaris subsp. vulgaris]